MKKILIDCGFNTGAWIPKLITENINTLISEPFHYYAFEPNEILQPSMDFLFDTDYFHMIRKAVSTYDGKRKFYLTHDNYEGSSFYTNTKKCCENKSEITVECIDFSKWIKDNFKKDDYIALKLNIETEEYQILSKMIDDDTIKYIDVLYVQWHELELRPEVKDLPRTKEEILECLNGDIVYSEIVYSLDNSVNTGLQKTIPLMKMFCNV